MTNKLELDEVNDVNKAQHLLMLLITREELIDKKLQYLDKDTKIADALNEVIKILETYKHFCELFNDGFNTISIERE